MYKQKIGFNSIFNQTFIHAHAHRHAHEYTRTRTYILIYNFFNLTSIFQIFSQREFFFSSVVSFRLESKQNDYGTFDVLLFTHNVAVSFRDFHIYI